ncbi:MAG: aldose 1-epimerase family protein [Fuerstiella sp.]
MNIVTIQDQSAGSHAKIAVDLGFNCFELTVKHDGRDVAVLHAADGFADGGQPPSHSGIPLLFPYPNRIRSGRYSWEGKDYHLPESLVAYEGAGNAIHGFCLDRPWRIVDQSDASVTAEFQISKDAPERLELWPTDGIIRIRYSLNGATLRAEIEVSNPTDTALPWGFGTHAYFKLPLSESSNPEQCTVYAPAGRRWELDQCLPTGRVVQPPENADLRNAPAFGGLKLDDVYTVVEADDGVVECRIADPAAGLHTVQRCNDSFREIVAFTPPWATAVCLEPYTCTTDAINLQRQGVDAGWQVLPPGQSWQGWIDIAVEAI